MAAAHPTRPGARQAQRQRPQVARRVAPRPGAGRDRSRLSSPVVAALAIVSGRQRAGRGAGGCACRHGRCSCRGAYSSPPSVNSRRPGFPAHLCPILDSGEPKCLPISPGLLSTALRPALVGQDLRRGEGPVPEPPGDPATADLGGQMWGWHKHHRAACPRHAVADNAAAGRAPKRAPVSRADHQHITRVVGDADHDPAGGPRSTCGCTPGSGGPPHIAARASPIRWHAMSRQPCMSPAAG